MPEDRPKSFAIIPHIRPPINRFCAQKGNFLPEFSFVWEGYEKTFAAPFPKKLYGSKAAGIWLTPRSLTSTTSKRIYGSQPAFMMNQRAMSA